MTDGTAQLSSVQRVIFFVVLLVLLITAVVVYQSVHDDHPRCARSDRVCTPALPQ